MSDTNRSDTSLARQRPSWPGIWYVASDLDRDGCLILRSQDAKTLMVEGVLAGVKGPYDCPIALRLFGTSDPIERADLRRRMRADKLPVAVLDQREAEAKRQKIEQLKKMEAARKAMVSQARRKGQDAQPRSSQTQFAGSSSQGESVPTPTQSIEAIIEESQRLNPRNIGEVVEKFGMGEDFLSQMPMAALPDRLSTKLLPYQRQALAWLVEKENPMLPLPGSKEMVQLWKRAKDPRIFTNIATNFSLKDQSPVLAKGGILAVSRR